MTLLDMDTLMRRARDATGLQDFGTDDFMQPFERLVASVNATTRPTALGAGVIAGTVEGWLRQRLQIEDWYRRHPEIDEQQIIEPLVITGLPRTGSTALVHMLSQDPQARTLRVWEAEQLCPPPELAEAETDPRIAECEARYAAFQQLVPGIRDALPQNVRAPEECYVLLHLSFAAPAFHAWAHIPDFVDYTLSDNFDWRPAYRYHQRVLKLLQWRHPAPRGWVLKAPNHMLGCEALHEVYPDAWYVMTHRDPVRTLPSVASLMSFMRDVFLEDPAPLGLGREVGDIWDTGLHRFMALRDRLGDARFFDCSHRQQHEDAAGQIEALYRWRGWAVDDGLQARVRHWQEDNPQGTHRPQPARFGFEAEQIAQRFSFYTQRFGAWI